MPKFGESAPRVPDPNLKGDSKRIPLPRKTFERKDDPLGRLRADTLDALGVKFNNPNAPVDLVYIAHGISLRPINPDTERTGGKHYQFATFDEATKAAKFVLTQIREARDSSLRTADRKKAEWWEEIAQHTEKELVETLLHEVKSGLHGSLGERKAMQ